MRSTLVLSGAIVCGFLALTGGFGSLTAQDVPTCDGVNVFCVSPSGSDSASGTQTQPWRTIQKAANTLKPGQTAVVRAGVYYRDGTNSYPNTSVEGIKPQNSGTASAPITYMAYPGESVIIDQQNAVHGFYIYNKSYIVIDGFEIRNAAWGGIRTAENCDHITIQNCHIHHVNGAAGQNVGAIKLDVCDYGVVRNCLLHDVTVAGDMSNQNGADIHSYDMSNAIIENNEMWNAANGVFHKRSRGIKGANIRNNLIHDIVSYGVRYSIGGVGDPAHVDQEVRGNIITRTPMGIFATVHETNPISHGLSVFNNVFQCSTAIYLSGYQGVTIGNNIFLDASPTLGRGAIVTVDNYLNVDSTIPLSDYNLYYPNAKFALNRGDERQKDIYNLAEWQTVTGLDAHSLFADPQLVNTTSAEITQRDYHLNAGSPAADAGRIGAVSSGAVIDIGAYPTGTEVVGPTANYEDTYPPIGVISVFD